MKKTLLGIAAATALIATACSSSKTSSPPPAAAPPPATSSSAAPATSGSAMLASASTAKGTVLTGPDGNTVYTYDPDQGSKSVCNAGCASAWPPVKAPVTAGTGVTASAIGTTSRDDGSKQATYNGHPIYYFASDSGPGQTSGDGVGGVWHVITVGAAAPATSASATSSGGGGGNGY